MSGQGRRLPLHQMNPLSAISQLHSKHAADATIAQRLVERVTRRAGTPVFVGVLTSLIASWIVLNLALPNMGFEAYDEPPFPWLQGVVATAALYIALLILATQQRDDQLAALRDQLALDLAILSEEKSAKIISLLEELRRDDPSVENRRDDHAHDLSEPADTGAVLEALKDDDMQRAADR